MIGPRPSRDSYRYVGTVSDNQGEPCELYQPDHGTVTRCADMLRDGVTPWPECDIPPMSEDRWDRDNLCLVGYILAGGWRDERGAVQPCLAARIALRNRPALDWLVEAHLSVVYYHERDIWTAAEQTLCNGSSCVPDRRSAGFWIKDPESVAHDVEWTRHFAGEIPDAFGRKPCLHRSNAWLEDVASVFGNPVYAAAKRAALDGMLAAARWNMRGRR